MESFADCLREVLEGGALTSLESRDLVLKEEDPNSKQTVRLTNAPPDLVVVDVSEIGQMSGLKKKRKENGNGKGYDWNKSCDYLLAFRWNGDERALLIDLKKTLGRRNKRKGMKQLRWSRPLLDYLWSIYEARNGARPGSLKLSAGYALITEDFHHESLNKQYVHLKSGETTLERYKNIDICIAVGKSVSWKKLLRIKERNGER